ncbi:MAG TPA: DUF2867 domain-containing protein [Roseiflexaceae bacterium]|nr:DUF2867 domain-containing protein [Roseiflexaceae bacterium]
MKRPSIQKVGLPTDSLIARAFPRRDYADAYRVQLPAGAANDLDSLVRATLGTAPGWIKLLLRLRDRLVAPFGLKTASGAPVSAFDRFELRPGHSVGLFKVIERTSDELLLGQDDLHLDFRVSVLVRSDGGADWVVISTIVRFNNWLGRAYFLPVRQFHKLIVPAMIRNAYQRYSERHG